MQDCQGGCHETPAAGIEGFDLHRTGDAADFEILGIRSVAQLAKQDPHKLYEKLGRVARQHQDICVLDTFAAAVAQARNPRLPAAQCQWWWWSRKRKQQKPKATPQ